MMPTTLRAARAGDDASPGLARVRRENQCHLFRILRLRFGALPALVLGGLVRRPVSFRHRASRPFPRFGISALSTPGGHYENLRSFP